MESDFSAPQDSASSFVIVSEKVGVIFFGILVVGLMVVFARSQERLRHRRGKANHG